MLKLSTLMKKITFVLIFSLFLSGRAVIEKLQNKNFEEIPSGTVLFSDSFEDAESGWRTYANNGSFVTYQAGGLRFFVDQANLDFWSSPGLKFDNVRIETEAIKIDGPDNNTFGVLCRMQDEANFYAFVLSSDGYAGIYKVVEGVYQLLNSSSMEFSTAIYQGEAINYLSANCVGNQLQFDINGETLFSVTDEQFQSGDVGLIAGSFEDPAVNIFFDNFTVFQP